MSEKRKRSRRYSYEEIVEKEAIISAGMLDWGATFSLQTQKPQQEKELAKDPLAALDLVN
ncbi:MAG: hypothetical protein RBS77_06290 [Candidatus Moranbacteria bacterium]|jgi:hypothetical protein|nr:hypothetical protein [Candidatus Moranbacteria bacterium]